MLSISAEEKQNRKEGEEEEEEERWKETFTGGATRFPRKAQQPLLCIRPNNIKKTKKNKALGLWALPFFFLLQGFALLLMKYLLDKKKT